MSKKLDEELARAIAATDEARGADASAPVSTAGVASPVAPPKRRSSGNVGLLVTLLVMVGAVVTLFLVGFKEAAIYATPVDQLLASKEKLTGRKVRVEGELVPGTLVKRDQPCEYRFNVFGGEKKEALPVRYAQCVVPDTFRDVPQGGVQVTIEGTLNADGNFTATQVMAKCTSKYDPATHEMKGEKPGAMPIN